MKATTNKEYATLIRALANMTSELIDELDGEPLDGDGVDIFADAYRKELNKQQGNE